MNAPNDSDSASLQPFSITDQANQIAMNSDDSSAQLTSPFINKSVRRAGRRLFISGVLLIGCFFSPLVFNYDDSPFGHTTAVSSFTIFRTSLGSLESDALSVMGILLIIFPLAGLAGALLGMWALQSSTKRRTVPKLRTFSIVVLVFALLISCPLLIVFSEMVSSYRRLPFAWGFYLNMFAAIGLAIGAFDLLKNWHRYS